MGRKQCSFCITGDYDVEVNDRKMRKKLKKAAMIISVLVLLPYIITVLISGKSIRVNGDHSPLYVKVNVGNIQKKVLWEEFFIGVLAKEMDVTYGDEALKAQAILTRTNLYRRIEENQDIIFREEYMTYSEMKNLWGETDAKKAYERLKKAARETDDKAILYNGKLASASFHQLSNGSTRNGKEVLGGEEYPYLKQKECPKDVESEFQLQTLTFTYDEVKTACQSFLVAVEQKEADQPFTFESFEVKAVDGAGYVTKVRIGSGVYPGEEFRNALGLPSSCFTLQDQNGNLKITTKGIGHGLGMSQYTANEMAKEGKTCEEILAYFFEGAEIKEVAEILLNIE